MAWKLFTCQQENKLEEKCSQTLESPGALGAAVPNTGLQGDTGIPQLVSTCIYCACPLHQTKDTWFIFSPHVLDTQINTFPRCCNAFPTPKQMIVCKEKSFGLLLNLEGKWTGIFCDIHMVNGSVTGQEHLLDLRAAPQKCSHFLLCSKPNYPPLIVVYLRTSSELLGDF